MINIAHISDLHVSKVRYNLQFWKLLNKRWTGAAFYLAKKWRRYRMPILKHWVRKILSMKDQLDAVVITGDISNISLKEEFSYAKALLKPLLSQPDFVFMIPGNHDTYTNHSTRRHYFQNFFSDQLGKALSLNNPFPYVSIIKNKVAIIGLNSAVPLPWFQAQGFVDEAQLRVLAEWLDDPQNQHYAKVLLVHHHLFSHHHHINSYHDMTDGDKLISFFQKHPVDLILHGHNHIRYRSAIPLEDGKEIPIYCAGSSTKLSEKPDERGGMRLYTISDHKAVSVEDHVFPS